MHSQIDEERVARALHRLFIAAEGTALRDEDRQKVRELVPLLREVQRVARSKPGVLVDACAGKSALGLLAAHLVLGPQWRVVVLERDERRVAAARTAIARMDPPQPGRFEARIADVHDRSAWPQAPDVVVALHACGAASDAIIEAAAAAQARHLLLVPCCYGAAPVHGRAGVDDDGGDAERSRRGAIPGQRLADAFVDLVPRGLAGRSFAQGLIDVERTLRLQAHGYDVDVVDFVAPTVTPHNLLWRARRSGESVHMAAARQRLDAWRVRSAP